MNELSTPNSLLTFIDRASRDPGFDINKFSVLLDRQEALIKQQQLGAFNKSYAEMQSEIKPAEKSGTNPIFRNPYAKLEDLDRAARAIYSKHGFSIRYGAEDHPNKDWIYVTLTISHDGGHSEKSRLAGPLDMARQRAPVQAVGSTITYLRRYLLQMVLNLVATNDPADNDGNRITEDDIDHRTGEVLDPIQRATTANGGTSSEEYAENILTCLREISDHGSLEELKQFWTDNQKLLKALNKNHLTVVTAEKQRLLKIFEAGGS